MNKKLRSNHNQYMKQFNGQPVTQKMIEACKTPAGGWTASFFKAIGETWPVQSGWRERAIGRIFHMRHEGHNNMATVSDVHSWFKDHLPSVVGADEISTALLNDFVMVRRR